MENGSYSYVLPDASWLTCVTTASDMEYWKVLLCFSLVGHELKVGHKTFVVAIRICDVSEYCVILDCFMAEVKFAFEKS